MSARDKLNATHLTVVFVVAGIVGLATNSAALAMIAAVILIVLGLEDGRLRPPTQPRPPPRSRRRSRRWR